MRACAHVDCIISELIDCVIANCARLFPIGTMSSVRIQLIRANIADSSTTVRRRLRHSLN